MIVQLLLAEHCLIQGAGFMRGLNIACFGKHAWVLNTPKKMGNYSFFPKLSASPIALPKSCMSPKQKMLRKVIDKLHW